MSWAIGIVCVIAYALMIGITSAVVRRLFDMHDEFDHTMPAIFWPISLPAFVGYFYVLRTFDYVDARRAEATKRDAELKQRIAELDEEIEAERREYKERAAERRAEYRRAVR